MVEDWEEYRKINRALEKFLDEMDAERGVKKAIRYAIKSGGKRTRPIILMLSAKLCGGSDEDVINAALAVELIHTASLIHDDIIDRGRFRRNSECLHVKYDESLAMLVGDYLISKSVELVSEYDEEVIKRFSRAGMLMAEGEILDIRSRDDPEFSEEDYYRCIWKKTASLFSVCSWAGCRIVSSIEEWMEKMHQFGRDLGMAYQLVDDMLEFMKAYGDKSSEIESITLPIIYSRYYGVEQGIKKVLKRIMHHVQRAKNHLTIFPDGEVRDKLLRIVDFMTLDLIRDYLDDKSTGNKLDLLVTEII